MAFYKEAVAYDTSGKVAALIAMIYNMGLCGNQDFSKAIFYYMDDFAPPSENDTAKYKKFLHKKTGVNDNRKIKDFTDKEFELLWQGIEQLEGFKEGTITEVFQVTQVRKSVGGPSSYHTNANQWISKEECINLARQGNVELEVCIAKSKITYLRSRPKSLFQKCLGLITEKINK